MMRVFGPRGKTRKTHIPSSPPPTPGWLSLKKDISTPPPLGYVLALDLTLLHFNGNLMLLTYHYRMYNVGESGVRRPGEV